MSSNKEMADYIELRPGDKVQVWDQWLDQFGQWQFYTCTGDTEGVVGHGVKARRPIGTTKQTAYEEVPGSRTTQQAADQPQCERIAYEDLQPGDIIQEGDEWKTETGRWVPHMCLDGSRVHVRHGQRARRPHNITQLQGERDEARAAVTQMMVQLTNQAEVLTEVRVDEKRLFNDLELLRSEYATVQKERDLARSEVARLSTELWARRPLEDRVASLTHELANAREDFRKLVKTNAENTDQFAEHTATLVRERDEARAKSDRLQELIDDLLDEPTAKQVQDMLRTWATELDWSVGCFGSFGRSQIDIIQQTMVAVIQRIETMVNPEGGSDDN